LRARFVLWSSFRGFLKSIPPIQVFLVLESIGITDGIALSELLKAFLEGVDQFARIFVIWVFLGYHVVQLAHVLAHLFVLQIWAVEGPS
jgi:hypothetical protein